MSRWKPDAEDRLSQAAIRLFAEQGYDETTVVGIAAAAGLTKRTFFRYFADKREVLFKGSPEFLERWLGGMKTAPPDAGPMAVVTAGLDEVVELFADRHSFARLRSQIISTHPDLQERELSKLQSLAAAITAALVDRGVTQNAATLAAQAGVTIFHVAFANWVAQPDSNALGQLVAESLTELRSVVAAPVDHAARLRR